MSKTYWNSEKNTNQTMNEFCELCKKNVVLSLIPASMLGLISIIMPTQVQASGYVSIHVPTYEYKYKLHCQSKICWYDAGYLDGRWDHQHGMGSSFACPRNQDIAPNYCRGYSNGWDRVGTKSDTTNSVIQGQSSSVTIRGDNNRVDVNQGQSSQQ
jgi:hypothetical protein